MPRFLKSKKKLVVSVLILIFVISPFTPFWYLSIVSLIGLCALYLNHVVLKKTNKSGLFSSKREIKKYNSLVIGDVCSKDVLKSYLPEHGNSIEIMMYGRSLDASFQILLHTFSILEEGGVCVIIHNGKKKQNQYNLFDIPYFNLIILKELDLENMIRKSKMPLFFEPIKSVRSLLWNCNPHYKLVDCPDKRIKKFCINKNIRLEYLLLSN